MPSVDRLNLGDLMNIFIRELKAHAKALIIWSVSMFLLVASGMAKYTAYTAGGQNNQIFNDLPYSVKALLGFGSFDIATMAGYFALLFLYIELVAAIHAVILGAGIIAKEERDKTSEFLMIKPVARKVVITAKLSAAFINIIILNLVTLAASIIMVNAYNKGPAITDEIFVFFESMLIVQAVFMTLGASFAAIMRNPKTSGSFAMGALLWAFFVSKITELNTDLSFLNFLSPFKYFDYADIVDGFGLNTLAVLLSLALAVILTSATYVFYGKRDLSI